MMMALRMAFPVAASDKDWLQRIELLCQSLGLTERQRADMFATAGRISGNMRRQLEGVAA